MSNIKEVREAFQTKYPRFKDEIYWAKSDSYTSYRIDERYQSFKDGYKAGQASLKAENERLRKALTPSAETKARHIGEYSFLKERSEYDEDGEIVEYSQKIYVPWATVKEIMKAIFSEALKEIKE